MELREIIIKIKKQKLILIFASLVGFLMGLIIYYLPQKFISSGALYVSRKINSSADFFTYEGYYAQQTALNYTNSVLALIESKDIQKELLEKMGEPVNEKNLRELKRDIKVKRTGPQVILVEIKNETPEKSKETWKNLSDIVISKSEELNKEIDNNLKIFTISKEPSIEETYKNLLLFSFAGLIIGGALGLIIISFKEYSKK
jgi:capsular polysaccharide biosynthesis protein